MTSFTPRPQWIVDLIEELSGTAGSAAWGSITGTLSAQTDLQTALNAKAATADIAELARDAVGAALVEGGGIDIVVNDAGDTITISASTSGGTLSGTSFPGSPASGDVFRRTDRQIEYYYDGTRWLSTQLFTVAVPSVPIATGITVSTSYGFNIPFLPTYDVWLVSWDTVMFRNAAGEWDAELYTTSSSNVQTLVDTQDGSADATSTYINRTRTLGQLIQTANVKEMRVSFQERSGTAAFIGAASVNYRLVG